MLCNEDEQSPCPEQPDVRFVQKAVLQLAPENPLAQVHFPFEHRQS